MTANAWVNLTANSGIYNSAKDELHLDGLVRIRSDAGYDMKTQSALMELKTGLMKTTEPVKVVLKAGSVDADQMQIVDNGQQVVFEGNVHSVILPEEQVAEAAALHKGAHNERPHSRHRGAMLVAGPAFARRARSCPAPRRRIRSASMPASSIISIRIRSSL